MKRSPLSPHDRELLEAYRHDRGLSPVHRARLWKAIVQRRRANERRARRARWVTMAVAVSLALVVGWLTSWVVHRERVIPSRPPSEALDRVDRERPAGQAQAHVTHEGLTEAQRPDAPAVPRRDKGIPPRIANAKQPAQRRAIHRSTLPERDGAIPLASRDAPPTPNPDEPIDAELRLLQRARRAIEQKAFEKARGPLFEHAQRFPRGVLTEERDALLAIVSCSSSRDEQVARRFAERYPHSPLLERVRQGCVPASTETVPQPHRVESR